MQIEISLILLFTVINTLDRIKVKKAIAKLAGLANAFPHRGRHSFGTDFVLKGVDPVLAMELMRQKTSKAFKRYTKRGLAIAAEAKFYEVYGESGDAL